MVNVGIVGLGFMGKMHYRCYNALQGSEVVAVCDAVEKNLNEVKGESGNICGA